MVLCTVCTVWVQRVLCGICGLVSQNNNVSPDITPLTTRAVQLRWHKPYILTTLTITTTRCLYKLSQFAAATGVMMAHKPHVLTTPIITLTSPDQW